MSSERKFDRLIKSLKKEIEQLDKEIGQARGRIAAANLQIKEDEQLIDVKMHAKVDKTNWINELEKTND